LCNAPSFADAMPRVNNNPVQIELTVKEANLSQCTYTVATLLVLPAEPGPRSFILVERVKWLFWAVRKAHKFTKGMCLAVFTDERSHFPAELAEMQIKVYRLFKFLSPPGTTRVEEMAAFFNKCAKQIAMKAFFTAMQQEKKYSHLVLLDSDMTVSGEIMSPFTRDFDIGLTYRNSGFGKDFNTGAMFASKNRPDDVMALLDATIQMCERLPPNSLNDQYVWNALLSLPQYQGSIDRLIAAAGKGQLFSVNKQLKSKPNCHTSPVIGHPNARLMFLPMILWNHIYSSKMGSYCGLPTNTRIHHFTGRRKEDMPKVFQTQRKYGVNRIKIIPKGTCKSTNKVPKDGELPNSKLCKPRPTTNHMQESVALEEADSAFSRSSLHDDPEAVNATATEAA